MHLSTLLGPAPLLSNSCVLPLLCFWRAKHKYFFSATQLKHLFPRSARAEVLESLWWVNVFVVCHNRQMSCWLYGGAESDKVRGRITKTAVACGIRNKHLNNYSWQTNVLVPNREWLRVWPLGVWYLHQNAKYFYFCAWKQSWWKMFTTRRLALPHSPCLCVTANIPNTAFISTHVEQEMERCRPWDRSSSPISTSEKTKLLFSGVFM